ncbi:MAG: TFIIB-type zinc ribbon-containing protein [Hungatella sp.]|nr:TFIIB-type zinc ribbon-containing protein [Hungatella sp.]
MATVSIKCPNCGGGLQFDPAAQNYECEYCLSRFTQEELEKIAPGESAEQGPEKNGDQDSRENAVVYTCPSCGAEIVTDETTAASFCFYCHNPVILQGRLQGEYHPDYVLPFAIDREKATEIFLGWLKKKRFVPADFYAPEQIEKMTGVYFPYWLYSCRVDGKLDGEGTKLRIWRTGNMQYTETQKYDVSRSGTMDIDHVPRNALKKADKKLVEGVMPFDTGNMKVFSMGFLSGFFAEKRDMEQQQFQTEMEQEVRDFAADSLRSSIGSYDSVNIRSQEARIRGARWAYALLPVWTLTYREHKTGNIYYFACNGQSGKVCGKLPVDSKKLWIFFAEIFVPLLAVLLAVGYMI